MLGYDSLVDALKQALNVDMGGTTQDKQFTLLPGPCLGACDHAPVLMVNDDYHFDVKATSVRSVLERYQQRSE
jgi:NADH-quinone oxidoreductase subunit E